jgi:hypothetical protein
VPDVENMYFIVPDAIEDHVWKSACDQHAGIRDVGDASGVWKVRETINDLSEKPLDMNG